MDTVVNGTAKAWVNFNGQGTVAIRRAFNVSSITDNGTGQFQVNFTTAMVDADYVVNGGSRYNDGSVAGAMRVVSINSVGLLADSMRTTDVRIAIAFANGSVQDVQVVTVTIFS